MPNLNKKNFKIHQFLWHHLMKFPPRNNMPSQNGPNNAKGKSAGGVPFAVWVVRHFLINIGLASRVSQIQLQVPSSCLLGLMRGIPEDSLSWPESNPYSLVRMRTLSFLTKQFNWIFFGISSFGENNFFPWPLYCKFIFVIIFRNWEWLIWEFMGPLFYKYASTKFLENLQLIRNLFFFFKFERY